MSELKDRKDEVLRGISAGAVDVVELTDVLRCFEGASHDVACPCGSGETFGHCCKVDLVILRAHSEKTEEAKESESTVSESDANADAQSGIKIVCRIGLTRDGSLAVLPGAVTDLQPIRIAELLLNAYHVVNYNATMAAVRELAARRNGNRTAGPALRSAFH